MTNTKKRILISGGTGLIGTHLSDLLLSKGFEVHLLSRSTKENGTNLFYYLWNPDKSILPQNLKGHFNAIINLAGEGIADKRWNESRKKVLLSSRVNPLNCLYQLLKGDITTDALIATSATGYYGADRGEEVLYETSKAGKDFIGQLCVKWEKESKELTKLIERVIILRFGIVLTSEGGALKKIAAPINLFAGSVLGSGNQYVSWIHIEDLCALMMWFMEEEENKGVYNAVSPEPVNYKTFITEIANVLNRPILLPPIPTRILNLMLGGMSKMITGSIVASPEKLQSLNFKFKYPDLRSALNNIYKVKS